MKIEGSLRAAHHQGYPPELSELSDTLSSIMTTSLCFLDCETNGVHLQRRPWEIAILRRTGDGTDQSISIYIDLPDLDLDHADPEGLQIGRFHDRHPALTCTDLDADQILCDAAEAAHLVHAWTAGATIVGIVPSFDTECLTGLLTRHGYTPRWHYRLVDVSVLAAGYLLGQGVTPKETSEELSVQCGVQPATGLARHTAVGDADWTRRWFDQLTATTTNPGPVPPLPT